MKYYNQLSRHDGNNTLFEVVEMAIISMLWDIPLHIHAEGLRGTGKTTIMRAARQVMPPIVRIKGCLYNCDPDNPHCPHHRHLSKEEIMSIGTETVPRPFLEISHSAKIGTIAGSIDLQKITSSSNPEAALLPGIIPQAHRGVIFIDEINRLADTSPELTDILLDVMGTKPGRVQIEETGLPLVELPVQVSVWAASNPDEEPGPLQEIRRQLSDRFDMVVEMARTTTPDAITQILLQSELKRLEKDPGTRKLPEGLTRIQNQLEQIAGKFEKLAMPDFLRSYIARLYVKYDLESFRAVEAIQHGAVLNCALREREQLLISDIIKVIPLALRHRVEPKTLTKIMNSSDSGPTFTEKASPSLDLSAEKKNEPATSSSDPKMTINEDSSTPLHQSTQPSSLLGSVKRIFTKIPKPAENSGPDSSIKVSPLSRAKRLHDINLEDLLKSEKDLNS